MAEYIDKSIVTSIPLRDIYIRSDYNKAYRQGWADALELVKLIPAADVRENVKGEWLYVVEEIEGTTFRGCRCSKCNYWKGMGIFNFCPNCGADMNTPKKKDTLADHYKRCEIELMKKLTEGNDG